jgi:hypothetical protein
VAFLLLKERFDHRRQFLNTAQGAEGEFFHSVFVLHELLADLALHGCPYLLVRIEMRRVRWQVEQFECAVEAVDVLPHELGLVNGVAVHDDEHGLGCFDHQALEKLFEHGRVHGILMNHETKVAARAHRRNHVEGVAAPGHLDDRRFANRSPGGAGMVVGTDAGLVGEVEVGAGGLRLGLDGRIGLGLPLLDQQRILLPSLIQRLLHGKTQQLHDAPDRLQRQGLAELAVDQFAHQRQRPQAKLELELLRRLVLHGLRNPLHFLGSDLRRAARDGLGEQGILAAFGKLGQPPENSGDTQAVGGGHARRRLAFAHRLDRLLAHDLKRVVVQFAAVRSSFAFHTVIILRTYFTF